MPRQNALGLQNCKCNNFLLTLEAKIQIFGFKKMHTSIFGENHTHLIPALEHGGGGVPTTPCIHIVDH